MWPEKLPIWPGSFVIGVKDAMLAVRLEPELGDISIAKGQDARDNSAPWPVHILTRVDSLFVQPMVLRTHRLPEF